MTLSNQTALTDTKIPPPTPSHHSSETGGTDRETEWKREWSQQWERKHFFGMRQNKITREAYFSKTKPKKYFMEEEKEAEMSWSEKFMISSETSSAWSSVVSLRDQKCHDLIGCQPETEVPDWLWHIPLSNPLWLTFPLMLTYHIIHEWSQLKCVKLVLKPSSGWFKPL